MKMTAWFLKSFFLIMFSTTWAFSQEPAAKHVILITVDGLRPEFYLEESWGMPNLRYMMENGVAAKSAVPVFPSVTYPNHTTLITGVAPASHGIYFNGPFNSRGRNIWYWYYDSIKATTLFDAMRQSNKKTASILWPVTVNAPIDYNIPPIINPETKDRTMATQFVRPLSLWKEVQDRATGILKPEDWDINGEELLWDQNIGRAASYIIQEYKPEFLAIHFILSDHNQHAQGRDNYQAKAAVSGIDRSLRSILEALKRAGISENTSIIVTGDHGFKNIYRRFNPNVLLREANILKDENDWKAVFYASGGSSFLYLKDKTDKQTLNKVEKLLNGVPDSVRHFFQVIDKRRLDSIGSDPFAVLALSGMNGTTMGNGFNGGLVESLGTTKGQHGFFPDDDEIFTGFVGYGAGFRKGVMVDRLELTDVTPIIVALSGIKFPESQLKTNKKLMKQLMLKVNK